MSDQEDLDRAHKTRYLGLGICVGAVFWMLGPERSIYYFLAGIPTWWIARHIWTAENLWTGFLDEPTWEDEGKPLKTLNVGPCIVTWPLLILYATLWCAWLGFSGIVGVVKWLPLTFHSERRWHGPEKYCYACSGRILWGHMVIENRWSIHDHQICKDKLVQVVKDEAEDPELAARNAHVRAQWTI